MAFPEQVKTPRQGGCGVSIIRKKNPSKISSPEDCLLPLRLETVSDTNARFGGSVETRELVEIIVRALVDSPEQVRVREIRATNMRILEIKVAKQDIGYLLGRKGKNIDALRTIISAVSKKERCMVEVLDANRPESWLDNGKKR